MGGRDRCYACRLRKCSKLSLSGSVCASAGRDCDYIQIPCRVTGRVQLALSQYNLTWSSKTRHPYIKRTNMTCSVQCTSLLFFLRKSSYTIRTYTTCLKPLFDSFEAGLHNQPPLKIRTNTTCPYISFVLFEPVYINQSPLKIRTNTTSLIPLFDLSKLV